MSGFYPRKLCEIMIHSLFPHVANRHVWSMPCVLREFSTLTDRSLFAGYPSVPLDVAMWKVGCKELVTPAYVHRLLDRSEWKDRPEVLEAINSEKQGISPMVHGMNPKSVLKLKFLLKLMPKGRRYMSGLWWWLSASRDMKSPAEWSIKARIVLRGDAVRDEDNQAAVFDELAASAPTSLGGLNLVIAFGLLDGHACSTSDCIKAYVQSSLDPSCPTYVLLPAELVPDYARHIHQPVAPLIRSLYGHPLASFGVSILAESPFEYFINSSRWLWTGRAAQLLSLPFFESCAHCLCWWLDIERTEEKPFSVLVIFAEALSVKIIW